jgi:hypothetical protein
VSVAFDAGCEAIRVDNRGQGDPEGERSAGAAKAIGKARLLQLDALRAAALLLVFGRDLEHRQSELPYAMHLVMGLWGRCGWIGVNRFLF